MTSRRWVSVSSADHSPSRSARPNRPGGAASTTRRTTPADERIRSRIARCSGLIPNDSHSAKSLVLGEAGAQDGGPILTRRTVDDDMAGSPMTVRPLLTFALAFVTL